MATKPPTPPPPPEPKSRLLWWVLGLLVAGVLLLSLGMYLFTQFMRQNVVVVQAPARVEPPPATEKPAVATDEASNPGLPIFPDAEVVSPGSTIELAPPDDDPLFITTARYRTSVLLPEVDAWYQEELGEEFVREGAGEMEKKGRIFGVDVTSEDVAFVDEKDAYMKVVILRRGPLGTEIALARISREEPH